jgi:antitoxin YefM
VIVRQKGEAVVMASLPEWNGMDKTLHLLSNPTNAARLSDAMRQFDAGGLAGETANPTTACEHP